MLSISINLELKTLTLYFPAIQKFVSFNCYPKGDRLHIVLSGQQACDTALFETYPAWREALRGSFHYVCFDMLEGDCLCQPIREASRHQGMNNLTTEFDLLATLSDIAANNQKRFAIVHMETDQALWATNS